MRRRDFLLLCAMAVPLACTRERADESPVHTEVPRHERPSDTDSQGEEDVEHGAPDPDPDSGPETEAGYEESVDAEGAERPEVDPVDYPTTAEEWGEQVTGVKTRLDTTERVVSLTFDACGGPGGDGYDEALVAFLVEERIPATLFFNRRWIEVNERVFLQLADEPLFEVANHGTEHRPLSVDGRSAYGVRGTRSPAEVIDEVTECQRTIERLTGLAPAHFRPGTAYCDEVAVQITNDLGLEVVNFDVLGDAGATFDSGQVTQALSAAEPGSVALLHMNQPGSGTAPGVVDAVSLLRDRGFTFARLGDHDLV